MKNSALIPTGQLDGDFFGLTKEEFELATALTPCRVIEYPCASDDDFIDFINSKVAQGYKIVGGRNGNLCTGESVLKLGLSGFRKV